LVFHPSNCKCPTATAAGRYAEVTISERPRRAQYIETELAERALLEAEPLPYMTSEYAWRIIRELEDR